jgi:hypothetical protein
VSKGYLVKKPTRNIFFNFLDAWRSQAYKKLVGRKLCFLTAQFFGWFDFNQTLQKIGSFSK